MESSGISELRSSLTILNQYNSFEQCNNSIIDMANLSNIDLVRYVELVENIPFDDDLIKYSNHNKSIRIIVKYFINVSSYDARSFRIPVKELDALGFNVNEYSSKAPKWIQSITGKADNQFHKEIRFLKKHKLVENIDYFVKLDAESNGLICLVTRPALYRLVANKYGMKFLEAIIGRMGQILFFFNDFKTRYEDCHIKSLQSIIDNLKVEIDQLKSNQIDMLSDRSFDGNRYSLRSLSSSQSFIASDSIMDSKEYTDELSHIHKVMETFIGRVDGRMTDVDYKLSTITSKIDDLVGSIILTRDEQSANTCFDKRNPLIEHVNDIFREYEQIGVKERCTPNYDYTTIISQMRSKRSEPEYYTSLNREEQL